MVPKADTDADALTQMSAYPKSRPLFGLEFAFPWSRETFELPLTALWAHGVSIVLVVVAYPLLELGGRFTQQWRPRQEKESPRPTASSMH